MADAPTLTYWHVYTDGSGISRQTKRTVTDWEEAPIQPGTDPQWMGPKIKDGATVTFTVLPANWVGEWHENPAPQWIIPLSGRWFVETMDGERVEMGPGEISFGADQGTTERDGRKGHLSGTVGDADCVMMLVQLESAVEGAPA